MGFEKFVIYETDEQRPSCHCASIVEVPSGDMLAVWYAGSQEGAPDVAVLSARGVRVLRKWRPAEVVSDTPGQPEGNPVVFLDQWGHVRLFYTTITGKGWSSARLQALKSEDEGRTWEQHRFFDEPLGTMPRNKPFYPDDETILLPLYDETSLRSFMYISRDRGETWERSGWIEAPTGCIQATVFSREDGTLVALMRDVGKKNIWRSFSDDGGWTWSPCEPTPLPNPGSGIDAVLLDSGNVVLAFNDTCQGRTPLSLAWSPDRGETWPLKVDIETEPGEYSYPAIIQDAAGWIHLAYTWRRKAIRHAMFDEDWLLEKGQEYKP